MKRPKWTIPHGLFQTVYSMPLWQKILIFLLAWSLPIGLYYFLYLDTRIGELDQLSGRIPKIQKEIAKLEEKKRRLPQIEKEIKDLDAILKRALKLLPEKKDIPSVLTDISSLGNEAGLAFNVFSPGGEKKRSFYAAIPVATQFDGSFHNIMSFFDRVSKMPRIVHINNVSMGKAKKRKGIWSQKGTQASGTAEEGKPENVETKTGAGDTGIERATPISTWVTSAKCTATTYRFLTEAEQKKGKKRSKKKRRKRRR